MPAQQTSQTESVKVISKEIKQMKADEHKDELYTKQVVEEFFQILLGKKHGDLI